ncbi:unnamed protein product [Rotaria magnacalcarata]
MEKSSIQTDKSSIFKRDERSQRPSTSSTSFEITEQQHRNSNSFMNPIPNNNNNNNNKGKSIHECIIDHTYRSTNDHVKLSADWSTPDVPTVENKLFIFK